MKQILIITIFALTVSCGLDNFSEPRSHLTGKVVYNGSPIGVRHGKVAFDIYQEGYELDEPVKVYIAQDGTFSAMLFDGDYRLVSTDGTAPWANGVAELPVTVRGNTYTELEVEPYYTLDDVNIVLMGETVRAVCNVAEVAGGKQRQKLSLLVGPRQILDASSYSYVAAGDIVSVPLGSVSINLDIPDLLASHETLYARLSLQMNGVAENIYSNVIRIK